MSYVPKSRLCDCSSEMIEIARSRYAAPNAEFYTCKIQELEIYEKADVVTSIQTMHYFQEEERMEAVKRCCDFLKPGGIFFNFENFAPYSEPGKRLYLDRWKSYQSKQGKSQEECERHIGRYQKKYFPITLSEHLSVMRSCGFRAAEIFWVSYMQAGIMGIK